MAEEEVEPVEAEEKAEVVDFQPKPRRPRKGRTLDKASQDRMYRNPSRPHVTAKHPIIGEQMTELKVFKFPQYYAVGTGSLGGRVVDSKPMRIKDAHQYECDMILRLGSRLSRDKPSLPE